MSIHTVVYIQQLFPHTLLQPQVHTCDWKKKKLVPEDHIIEDKKTRFLMYVKHVSPSIKHATCLQTNYTTHKSHDLKIQPQYSFYQKVLTHISCLPLMDSSLFEVPFEFLLQTYLILFILCYMPCVKFTKCSTWSPLFLLFEVPLEFLLQMYLILFILCCMPCVKCTKCSTLSPLFLGVRLIVH